MPMHFRSTAMGPSCVPNISACSTGCDSGCVRTSAIIPPVTDPYVSCRCDLGDNIAVQLTNNEFEDSYPRTSGEKIVWQAIAGDGTSIQLAEPKEPRASPIN